MQHTHIAAGLARRRDAGCRMPHLPDDEYNGATYYDGDYCVFCIC